MKHALEGSIPDIVSGCNLVVAHVKRAAADKGLAGDDHRPLLLATR